MRRHRVPGLAWATMKNCEVEGARTFGVANAELRAPVGRATAFEAASLSKPLFAYLYLAESRGAALDTPVAETIAYPRIVDQEALGAITPRLLLTHRSGLPNWAGPSHVTDRTTPLELRFAPGTAFSYSGEGYVLLQRQWVAATGTPLEAHLRRRLGDAMPRSSYAQLPPETHAAHGHGDDGYAFSGRRMHDHPQNAATSLRTVVEDYARFLAIVCRGEGLPAGVRDEMLRPQARLAGDEFGAEPSQLGDATIGWALGWGVQESDGRTIHFHWGDNGAFRAFVAFDAAAQTGSVFFSNGENGLAMVPLLVEPYVGSLAPTLTWLNY